MQIVGGGSVCSVPYVVLAVCSFMWKLVQSQQPASPHQSSRYPALTGTNMEPTLVSN